MRKSTYKKNLKKHHKKHKKTRKLIKKGGDIMYNLSSPEAKDMWREDPPAENLICSDDKVCLAFGEASDKVKDFFDGFTRFNFTKEAIKRIGEPSANGFVFELENETRGYKAYSVLKSAQEPSSDNLMYEYIVGQYINKVNKLYPCFLETYGLFKYRTNKQWEKFSTTKEIMDMHALQAGLAPQPINYAKGCRKSKHLAILIQHLPKPKTLDELTDDPDFIKDELMGALFQLYVPLAQLKDNFTHYDLHLGNLLMYEPVKDKYIEYHYHYTPTVLESSMHLTDTSRTTKTALAASMQPNTISFKSSYMLKIIDYGRSYFKDEESGVDAKQIYGEICQERKCNTKKSTCGENFGFSWLGDDSADPEGHFYISSQHKNISHDLLPLDRLYIKYEEREEEEKKKTKDKSKPSSKVNAVIFTPEIDDLIKRVDYEHEFGTSQNLTVGYPAKIYNVQDASNYIMECVKRPEFQTHNNAVNRTKDKLGDLHIYLDGSRPMKFIPTRETTA